MCICLAFSVGTLDCECWAEGQEKSLRKQKNQGQQASQETAVPMQLQHLNQPLQTDMCECPLVLGPTTHNVRCESALEW